MIRLRDRLGLSFVVLTIIALLTSLASAYAPLLAKKGAAREAVQVSSSK